MRRLLPSRPKRLLRASVTAVVPHAARRLQQRLPLPKLLLRSRLLLLSN